MLFGASKVLWTSKRSFTWTKKIINLSKLINLAFFKHGKMATQDFPLWGGHGEGHPLPHPHHVTVFFESSFLVNLEACRLIAGNFFIKWTPSQAFFWQHFKLPHALAMFWLKTCGKACQVCIVWTRKMLVKYLQADKFWVISKIWGYIGVYSSLANLQF